MDPRVREVIEGALNSCNNEVRSIQPFTQAKMGAVIETCFSKNSSNADRFADCIHQKNKKVEQVMKTIEFKFLYFSKNANECLKKKSVQDCTQQTIKGVKQVIENTKKNIERI